MRTETLAEDYLRAKGGRWAPATLETASIHLHAFARACPDLPEWPEQVEAFLATIPGETYRWNHYRTLRAFYDWAARRRRVPNPMPEIERPKKPEPRPYWLDERDLVRLLSHPDHSARDRALLFFLTDNGPRIGEAHSLTPERLYDGLAVVVGKTWPRAVPVHPRVDAMLRAIIPPDCPRDVTIWWGRKGPLTLSGMKQAVRDAFARAGLQGYRMSAHRLRHTFATLWDGPDQEGMAITGHRDERMWKLYHHLRDERVREAHAAHSPLAQLGLV